MTATFSVQVQTIITGTARSMARDYRSLLEYLDGLVRNGAITQEQARQIWESLRSDRAPHFGGQ